MYDRRYLDLLVRPEGDDDSNLRGHRDEERDRAEQDRDDFDRAVRAGCQQPLRRGHLVSIRAHTKMGGPVVLQMLLDDANGRFVPVSRLGPERAETAAPLTQEQVETHVLMMLAMLAQCHTIRRELRFRLRDEHVEAIQGCSTR